MRKVFSISLLLLSLFLTSCRVRYRHQVEAPGTPAKWKYGIGGFARYDGYEDVAGDLEVAVRDYKKPGSQVTVKFVGVIHIGDKLYYKEIQKILDRCDLVLYEGVKVKGTNPFKQAKKPKDMYWPMAQILGLTTQLHEIDYRRKHFKHCDVTLPRTAKTLPQLKQMAKAMQLMGKLLKWKKRLSSILPVKTMEDYLKHTYALTLTKTQNVDFRQIGKQLEPMIRALELYRKKYPGNPYIEKLYRQLQELKQSFERLGKFILEERNLYVIKKLKKEIERAEKLKKPYTIALFYGAAHMPDLEKRLAKIGYKPVKTTWLKAWRINTPH